MSAPITTTTLSEAASKRLLARHGIPVVEERTAVDPAAALAAARELGFPVVLKLCADRITHKTERGLVRLGLGDGHAVLEAGQELLGAARPGDGAVELLVARQVRGTRELIAGLLTDAQFGPCVMLGVGGVLAEAIGDVVFRVVPLTPADATEMIEDLGTQALLDRFRGEPAVDRVALRDVLLGLADVARSEPEVVAVDLNPLVVEEGRPVAVDALVEVRA